MAPHGYEHLDRSQWRTEFRLRPPMYIPIVTYTEAWCLYHVVSVDSGSDFLQTGTGKGSVYVVPPLESDQQYFMASAYSCLWHGHL